jgi:Carbohydrate esterase, sialic acid-specific acetylesterase
MKFNIARILILIWGISGITSGQDDCKQGPLQVFLLDGQSNMVGMGSLDHLRLLINDTTTRTEYKHLWNYTSNNWAERDDVYIKFGDQVGKLRAGLGAADGDHIGPELEFGWVLGDYFSRLPCRHQQPILLLKAAYGGRNLAIDFRPPLSGVGNYSGTKPMYYGWEYRQMITDIQTTLDNELPNIIPNYNRGGQGYTLAGLVWFQGWSDMLNLDMVKEYEFNLANLIRSIRLDLESPNLPVILGELGMHGLHPKGEDADRVLAMRAAERRVAQSAEFSTTSLFVRTAPYVVENGTSYNGEYHYNGRGMLHLLGQQHRLPPLKSLESHSMGSLMNLRKEIK